MGLAEGIAVIGTADKGKVCALDSATEEGIDGLVLDIAVGDLVDGTDGLLEGYNEFFKLVGVTKGIVVGGFAEGEFVDGTVDGDAV